MTDLFLEADPKQIAIIGVFGFFILILVIFSIIKGAKAGKGLKQLKEEYSSQIRQELNFKYHQGFVTSDELFIGANNKNNRYLAVFPLSEISYVRSSKDRDGIWSFNVYGEDNKPLKGELADGKGRKPRKIANQFPLKRNEADYLCDLLIKIRPEIEKFSM